MNENESPSDTSTKKSVPPLAWVGLGCGVMLLAAVVAFALFVGFCARGFRELSRHPEKSAAEMIVRLDPHLEKVSEDESKGEMTVRLKNGEVRTMSYDDIASGMLWHREADGEEAGAGDSRLVRVPEWVPRVPNADQSYLRFQTDVGGKSSGLFSATTDRPVEELDEYFSKEAEKLGMSETTRTSLNLTGAESRMTGYAGSGKELTVILIGRRELPVQVQVAYEEE